MLIRQEDLDDEDEFYEPGHTIVGCVGCGHMCPLREWLLVETSDDGVMHMVPS